MHTSVSQAPEEDSLKMMIFKSFVPENSAGQERVPWASR